MSSSVKPELLGGFRDLMPAEAYAQQQMFEKIRRVYESFGFMPLDTPGMERLDVLTGGSKDFEKSIFTARIIRGAEDRGVKDTDWEEAFAMRFDLTVPLARVVAANPELPRPFKRYQLGKVWRGEKPQSGRYREFWQFDFDIIGADSVDADIEVIQIMYETMKALGLSRFVVRYNTRKVLNGLAELVGCSNQATEFFRILDKADKLGVDGVIKALQRKSDNQYDTSLALSDEQAASVRSFLMLSGTDDVGTVDQLEQLFSDRTAIGRQGVSELRSIDAALDALGIPAENRRIDLSVARGLDYYTGPVFETVLLDLPQIGSVFSGGRFDGLTDRFIPGSNIAGVGASVGVDRLFVAMQQLGLLQLPDSITKVFVATQGADPAVKSAATQIAQSLRRQGINVECNLGNDPTLRAQMAYAAKRSIPYVVIIGADEVAKKSYVLKDMATRQQEVLTRDELSAKLATS